MALAGTLLAALALAACGEKSDQLSPRASKAQSLSLMLDWLPNADHVGLYQALSDGAFRAAGLNVTVRTPTRPPHCSCCRPARSTSPSPTSPSCCSPATRERRWWPSERSSSGP